MELTADNKPGTTSPARLPWAIGALAIFLSFLSLILGTIYTLNGGASYNFFSHQIPSLFPAVIYAALGGLVASRQPRNAIGWIFLIVGMLYSLSSVSSAYIIYGPLITGQPVLPGDAIVGWINRWIWIPAIFLPTTFVLLLFPDGHPPSPRWRPVAWLAGIGLLAYTLGQAFYPGRVEIWEVDNNPFGIEGAARFFDGLILLGQSLLIITTLASIAALITRFRRSQGSEREQMKWLVYACVLLVIAIVFGLTFYTFIPESILLYDLSIVIWNLMIAGIAVSASIAILRYRLYEIDLIINRTLVYGALTAVVILLYALIVGIMSALFQTQGNWIIALIATGLVAVLFQPLRERLQRAVNRLLYGRRDEPFEVLSQLGQRLEDSMTPEMVFPMVVETVSQTLKLPYTAIAVHREGSMVVVESYGRPVPDPLIYPLTYQGETIGRLLVAPRAPGEPFNEADERLLRNIAQQAGTAVYAAQLAADLQLSRQHLVTTREEERRRLRRDLHDGLGPTLAALHVQSGVLRRMIRQDPETAEGMVDEFRDEIRGAIDDIRRVVYELRPPALDELGLVAAIQAQADRCSRPASAINSNDLSNFSTSDSEGSESLLQVQVKAPNNLPPLPAAVEVAAYRIVQEALTNVVHHAQAQNCKVNLGLNGALELEVIDDGIGLGSRGQSGVGLMSMRERAEELGGRCRITSLPGGGTQVWASLPYSDKEVK